MPYYRVEIYRTEYLSDSIEVEADTPELAQDKAWDLSGSWKCVDAEEYVYSVEEINHAPTPSLNDNS